MKKMTLIIGAAMLVLMLIAVSGVAGAKTEKYVDATITVHVRDAFLNQPVISTFILSDGKMVGGVADTTFKLTDVKKGSCYTVTVNTGTGQTGTAKFKIGCGDRDYEKTIYVKWIAPSVWQLKGLSYATLWNPEGTEMLAVKFGASAGELEFIQAGRDMGMTFTNPELGVWIFKDGSTKGTLQVTPDYPW